MIWNKVDIQTLLAIGLATLDESGNLLDANTGFMRLIQNQRQALFGTDVGHFFIQPNFATIVGMPADVNGEIFNGLLTLGDYFGLSRTLHAIIWREPSAIRVFVEYDVEGMERLSETISDLNRDYAKAQHDLAQTNMKLKQLIVELGQREEQIQQLAFYDTLTHLPNRHLLNERLSQYLAVSKRTTCYNALIFLDLDNFKSLNDAHGHMAGDLLLIEAADRLRKCVRETDTVARFGGDEFVVFLNGLAKDEAKSTSNAKIVAETILATLSEPYFLAIMREGKPDTVIEHRCTASIGIVMFSGHHLGAEAILRLADAAMYQAKNAGKNQIRFYAFGQ
jgi:diguanylate cyclase (GGDEF)-like protein